MFEVSGTSDKFWNRTEFVRFLAQNQNQHIEFIVVPEAICLRSLGVYDLLDAFSFQSVTIHTRNQLETHPRYTIKVETNNFWLDKWTPIDPDLHHWDQSNIFMCLYHRPTAARLGIASYAQQYSSVIHFSVDTHVDSLPQFEFDKLLSYDVPSVARAANLLSQLPILISSPERLSTFEGYDYRDPLTNFYRKIFVDMVVESHVLGNTYFPTEKIIRPMLLKKPFVVFASVNYLEYLRQMGFLTFNNFWDEEYDGFECKDRLIKIYKVIDSIANRSRSELTEMYHDMQHILDHNYNTIVHKKFKRLITPI